MRNTKNILCLFIITMAVIISGCSDKKNDSANEKQEAKENEKVVMQTKSQKEIDLQIASATLQTFSGIIKLPAKVLSNQDNEALVGSLVQGRVHKVFVKAGDYVKAGQILMDIEGLEIGQIKADYLTDKATLEVTKQNYERIKTLSDEKIGSQKSLQEAQAEYKKALAEFNAEDKKIHSIGLTDEEITSGYNKPSDEHTAGTMPVKAPISGMIVERNVVIGQLVDGAANAFRIMNTASVWIDGQANEYDVKNIQGRGKSVFKTAAYPDESFNGTVSFINPVIDEKTRTFTVRVEMNNADKKLKPQMFGELQLDPAKGSKAILIPAEAVVKISNIDCIFIPLNDTVFIKRKIVTGAIIDDMIEIKSGLNEGEKFVKKGAFYLKSELMKDEMGGEE